MSTDARYWRTPLDLERWPIPHGRVEVLSERCKGCQLCVDYCPLAMLEMSTEMNQKGYRFPIVSPDREDDCVACGYCQSVCPDFAIIVASVERGSS